MQMIVRLHGFGYATLCVACVVAILAIWTLGSGELQHSDFGTLPPDAHPVASLSRYAWGLLGYYVKTTTQRVGLPSEQSSELRPWRLAATVLATVALCIAVRASWRRLSSPRRSP